MRPLGEIWAMEEMFRCSSIHSDAGVMKNYYHAISRWFRLKLVLNLLALSYICLLLYTFTNNFYFRFR